MPKPCKVPKMLLVQLEAEMQRKEKAIYLLRCPISSEVKWIGQSSKPHARLYHHLSRPSNYLMEQWIKDLKVVGMKPIVELVCKVESRFALRAERAIMNKFAKNGSPLLNMEIAGWHGKPEWKTAPGESRFFSENHDAQLAREEELAIASLIGLS